MATDYRLLCKELFKTDDVEELKKIAQSIHAKNIRNAGRKRRLSDLDIEAIKKQLANGETMAHLAEQYGTSRQVIARSINRPCDRQFPMQIRYMYGNKICTIIYINFLDQVIEIENRTDDMIRRAFGVKENPTWEDFEIFLEDRCFPKTRCGMKEILKELNLDSYDPLQIVEKTQGRMVDDNMHMEFRYYNGKGMK